MLRWVDEATETELVAAAELLHEFFLGVAPGIEAPPRGEVAEWWAGGPGERTDVLVAEDQGRAIGMAVVSRPLGGSAASLRPLVVATDARRRGVGGELLAEVCRALAADGIDALVTQSADDDPAGLAFATRAGVARDHRGRGLAQWLKAATARRLLAEHPEVTTVQTWNAADNAPMLAINSAMGFRPVGRVRNWRLTTDR